MSLDGVIELLHTEAPKMRKPILVGMGNEINGDDGVGNYIAQKLVSEVRNIVVMDVGTQPDNFTMKIVREKPSHVIFVDAAMIDGPGGHVAEVPLGNIDEIQFHTHYVPLSLIIDRIRGRCPCQVLVIGIQPDSTVTGNPLSVQVRESADGLITAFIELDSSLSSNG